MFSFFVSGVGSVPSGMFGSWSLPGAGTVVGGWLFVFLQS